MQPESPGRRLAQLRTKHHYTQAQFAALLGVAARTYQTYERDESAVPGSLLVALEQHFGTDPLWVLTGRYPSRDVLDLAKEVGVTFDEVLDEMALTLPSDKKWEYLAFLMRNFAAKGVVDKQELTELLGFTIGE